MICCLEFHFRVTDWTSPWTNVCSHGSQLLGKYFANSVVNKARVYLNASDLFTKWPSRTKFSRYSICGSGYQQLTIFSMFDDTPVTADKKNKEEESRLRCLLPRDRCQRSYQVAIGGSLSSIVVLMIRQSEAYCRHDFSPQRIQLQLH